MTQASHTIDPYAAARERMIRVQLEARGIRNPRVLAAMRKVPRHFFVEEALTGQAYGDYPLPIGEQQTISQPYIVALMTEALELQGTEKVLEIGTGSGYQAAVLAECAAWHETPSVTVDRTEPTAFKEMLEAALAQVSATEASA